MRQIMFFSLSSIILVFQNMLNFVEIGPILLVLMSATVKRFSVAPVEFYFLFFYNKDI